MQGNKKAKLNAISTAYSTIRRAVHGESRSLALQTANDTIAAAWNNAMQGEKEKIDEGTPKLFQNRQEVCEHVHQLFI